MLLNLGSLHIKKWEILSVTQTNLEYNNAKSTTKEKIHDGSLKSCKSIKTLFHVWTNLFCI